MTYGATTSSQAMRTYLRIGGEVFPVYGDEMRGFSPLAADIRGMSPSSLGVYESLDELYFALVNLYTASTGES